MIRKLRKKFILTNMALVSLVLLIVFAVLVGSSSQRLTAQAATALRMALEWGGDNAPPRFEFAPPPDGADETSFPLGDRDRGGRDRQSFMIPVFCAEVGADGSVSALHIRDGVEVSDAVLEQAVAQALASGRHEGVLSKLGLRFLMDGGESARIAFADLGWERESLRALVLSSLLVGAGALLCFFLISLFLSKVATRPVEKAWEQQRQFVADASHELKTPLTVILANSGILLSHKEDTVAAQAKWVEYIREEAVRMKSLVEDMLFLAKSDAAKSGDPRQAVDFSEVATGCLLPFESVAFERGVSLESDVAPALYTVGDEGQLRRLIMILLDNACKYTPRGGAVTVALRRSQDRLRLTVHNTGAPIPPEHLDHLFERFYRSDSARSRDQGGYGLGLAIAKSIAEGHRGKITAESAEGAGTDFTVTLPAAR